MKKNIDDLSLQIMGQEAAEALNKGLPPRIKSKLAYWFKKQGRRVRILENPGRTIAEAMARKAEELQDLEGLKKNQFMARIQSDGTVRMDFGSNVPEQVKKAAMGWAKRKGLTPIEADLKKSGASSTMVRFQSPTPTANAQTVAKLVWEIE